MSDIGIQQTWVDRLLDERNELYEKISALRNMVNNFHPDVSPMQRAYLKEQVCIMTDYLAILEKRITLSSFGG